MRWFRALFSVQSLINPCTLLTTVVAGMVPAQLKPRKKIYSFPTSMLAVVRLYADEKDSHPDARVLLRAVIGRGGETINRLQNESGCRIQVSQGTS